MENTEAKTVFSRLLELEPPVPDIAPYIDSAQTSTRRRRMAITAGSAMTVAVVVGAILAVPALLGGGMTPSPQVVAGPGTRVPDQPPDDVPFYPRSTESPAQAAARLNPALKAALALPPEAQLVVVTSSAPRSALPLGFYPSQGGYKATADVTDPAGISNIFVDVSDSSGAPLTGDSCQDLPADHTCTSKRTSTGDHLTVVRQAEASGVIRLSVSSMRLDGTSVLVSCINYGENRVPQGKNPPAPTPQRPAPICTEDQLEAVALAPALSYHPPDTAPLAPQPTPSPPSSTGCPPARKCPPGPAPR